MHFAHILPLNQITHSRKVFANRILDVFERLRFGLALGPAAGQTRTRYAEAFLRFVQ